MTEQTLCCAWCKHKTEKRVQTIFGERMLYTCTAALREIPSPLHKPDWCNIQEDGEE